jgi:hypothetical protein
LINGLLTGAIFLPLFGVVSLNVPQKWLIGGYMSDKVPLRRTQEVRMKLGPDMLSRLGALAETYGFPLATMSAMAVAEWVVGKEAATKNQRMVLMDMGRQMGGDFAKMLEAIGNDPEALAAAGDVAQRVKDQLEIPLDGTGAVGG